MVEVVGVEVCMCVYVYVYGYRVHLGGEFGNGGKSEKHFVEGERQWVFFKIRWDTRATILNNLLNNQSQTENLANWTSHGLIGKLDGRHVSTKLRTELKEPF